jgi:hypothetical protein|tara:strand:- start:10862 stop:11536 length:675 start_codon:yes stop_codon:yes gene_type:complete
MLSTSGMSAGSGKVKPVIDSGNQLLKINSITLNSPPYDQTAYDMVLNVESGPMGADFEGFLVDVNNPSGPRYNGQVGRVKFQRYAFNNATLPSGREVKRDEGLLKALINLAEVVGKRSEVDAIQANTIEDFVNKASTIICDGKFYNFCIGGREWENKEGYTNLDMFLPRFTAQAVPMESQEVENSKLITFNASEHVIALKNKPQAQAVNTFEPVSGPVGGDFDL